MTQNRKILEELPVSQKFHSDIEYRIFPINIHIKAVSSHKMVQNCILFFFFFVNKTTDLFKCAYEVNKNFTFEYKAKKIIMKLKINDNKWISDVIKIIEKYNK